VVLCQKINAEDWFRNSRQNERTQKCLETEGELLGDFSPRGNSAAICSREWWARGWCGGTVWKHTNGCASIHKVSLVSRRICKVNKAAEGIDLPAAAI
jgi:hypothetical protein